MGENIVLVTMVDDGFLPGYVAFMKSLLHHNEWFNCPVLIIDNGLSDESKNTIYKLYKPVSFRKPSVAKYSKIDKNSTTKELQATYFKLDIFSYVEFDRIVFIDSDVLVLGDIQELFTFNDGDMGACPVYGKNSDSLGGIINSGIMVLRKPVINNETYQSLLKEACKGHSMPDQKTINNVLGPRIVRLPKKYNMEKRMYHSKQYDWREAAILHFVSHKPWYPHAPKLGKDKGFEEMEKLWRYWYGR